jgi:hypothetical protein
VLAPASDWLGLVGAELMITGVIFHNSHHSHLVARRSFAAGVHTLDEEVIAVRELRWKRLRSI